MVTLYHPSPFSSTDLWEVMHLGPTEQWSYVEVSVHVNVLLVFLSQLEHELWNIIDQIWTSIEQSMIKHETMQTSTPVTAFFIAF